jgi:ferrous iron transport protein A
MNMNAASQVKLGELEKGKRARIISIDPAAGSGEICARLMEMGLLEGSLVEVVHEAPFGGDPIAVRVRGAMIALRRNEANHIWVQYER